MTAPVPFAYYTDWPGYRVYAETPHEFHELGLELTFGPDAPASDYWKPLYEEEPARPCRCCKEPKPA